jgi:AAHS family 4-hydroxybenzoate transporter-like MFS transporter
MNRSTAVNVQTFINEHPFSPFQWLVFFMCFIIVLLDGFDTAAIGFIAPSLIAEWGITRPALAPVLSAALFGLACGALGSGPLSTGSGDARCCSARCCCSAWRASARHSRPASSN